MGSVTGYTSSEGSVSYTYDANSNVLTVTDSHGTLTRTFDALNRVLSYTDTYGKIVIISPYRTAFCAFFCSKNFLNYFSNQDRLCLG